MACRALCRSVHRLPLFSPSTRSFRLRLFEFKLQALSQTPVMRGALLPYFPNLSPFSSTPHGKDQSEEVTLEGVVKEDSIFNSNVHELAADGSLDITSPVDLITACFDALHSSTGLPWWATISVSAFFLRALMVPLKVIQTRKLAEIRSLEPKLQLERLATGLSQGKFLEEWRQLRKRQKEVSSPSLFWVLGPGIFIQVPVVYLLLFSLRTMALEQHMGFTMGGMLWFEDLTVPGQGLAGAVLPLVVATVYFANVHVLFQGQPIRKGLFGDFQKAWQTFLKCSTLFIFWWSCYVPQALHMFFVPHSLMTFSQTVLFENDKFVRLMVGPKKNVGFRVPAHSGGQDIVALSSYEKLLKDAGTLFTSGNSSKAIELLKDAMKEEPEKGDAFALLGLVYKAQKDWANSALYYKQAISKGETDDFKIAAYAGCGLALLKKGAVMECIETVRPIRSLRVPNRPDSRHCYYASLVILGRALLEAGLKDESQEVVRLYKELDMEKIGGNSAEEVSK